MESIHCIIQAAKWAPEVAWIGPSDGWVDVCGPSDPEPALNPLTGLVNFSWKNVHHK